MSTKPPCYTRDVALTAMPDDKTCSVTWLGHATAMANFAGTRVLFDPLGRSRTRAAGEVSVILVTHSHVDHLNRWSLKAAPRSAHLVVPRGAGFIVRDLGFANVTEMTAGAQLHVAGLEISAVATRHDNGRWSRRSMPECCGYVVRAASGGPALHHAGDVDFSDHSIFDEIGKQHQIAASLLPIGGMLPGWYYRMRRTAVDRGVHIDPDCALRIFEQLGAHTMVPVHWGTVNLRLGRPSEPKLRLTAVAGQRGIIDRVSVLGHGESLLL
jgi:L-ascorbate metabolism protein UlaG (beta-lactamase superfamily)